MADNFYTLAETASKLGKSEDDVKQMIKNGELREFRDGSSILCKSEDVDKLAVGDIDLLSDEGDLEIGPAETGEISLASSGSEMDIDEDIFALADTQSGAQGSSINILAESDLDFKISDDTHSDTSTFKVSDTSSEARIDDDVNLDSFGSGSGLLDLSLQADDTSLGADILEDIYSADAAEGLGMGVAADAPDDEIFGPATSTRSGAATGTGVAKESAAPAAVYAATAAAAVPGEIDRLSGIYSTVMVIGLVAIIYVAIVVIAATKGIATMLTTVLDRGFMAWYVMGGLLVITLAIVGIGGWMSGQGGKPKVQKAPKSKKSKKSSKSKK